MEVPAPASGSRGPLITAAARGLSVGVAALCLVFMWDNPGAQPLPALALVVGFLVLHAAVALRYRGRRSPRPLRIALDVADALAVTTGAAFSGYLASPVWLLLYIHVVGVSVRGGLGYAVGFGLLDSALVALLATRTPDQPLGALHALTMLVCAVMGGITSSHLKHVQRSLARTNADVQSANVQLQASLQAHETARTEQDRAFQLLRESEERYRRLLERIQDGVLIVQDGRIAYANTSAGLMVGDTPQGLLGLRFQELVPPEDHAELADRYRRWEESQAVSGVLETRLLRRDGETRLVSLRAGSVEYGGRRSIIATVRDITRERRMEQDVKAHAARLAAVNEIAGAVNLSLTIEDILAVAAEEARRLVPFDRLTIALLDDSVNGVEVVAVDHGITRRPAGVSRQEVPWAFRRPTAWVDDGTERAPAHVHDLLDTRAVRAVAALPLMSKDRVIGSLNLGRERPLPFATFDLGVLEPVARHIAIALDNARLIEAVRRRSREFESLLDLGREVMERLELAELLPSVARSVNRVMGTHYCVLLLRDGNALTVGAQEGLEPEVVAAMETVQVGQSLSGWVAREGRPLFVGDMRTDPRLLFADTVEKYGYRSYLGVPLRRGAEILGTLEVVTKEIRRFTDEEQELMSAFAAQAAVAIENGRLYEQVRASLTRVMDANRQLEDLDRMRQEYLRNVSHEFRTPLTVIKGYAEFLHDSGSPGEAPLRNVTRIIMESCDRVIDMVDTLIELSRVEQGAAEKTLHVTDVDARDLVATALDPLRHSTQKKAIQLEVDIADPALRLRGDQGLLTQVVRKLADNAIKYSAAGARVSVRGRICDASVVLEVEDWGMGIPPEHQPHIFEKFYMGDGGLTRRMGGTGVGLYLVQEIVRLHRGTVAVRSAPGKGSLFTVQIPSDFNA